MQDKEMGNGKALTTLEQFLNKNKNKEKEKKRNRHSSSQHNKTDIHCDP